MHFDIQVPTRVVFGRGTLSRVGELTAEHGRRALLVTGRRAARAHGHLERVTRSLNAAGVETHLFDGVAPNPSAADAETAVALARRHDCDVVVGLGGGSALDTAKAVSVAAPGGKEVAALVGTTLPDGTPALPVVAVPTTAGSGAEVTKGAILTDPARGLRSGIRGACLFPRTAVVDPALVGSAPPEVAAAAAFDALAHALEGYVARRSTPVSRSLSRQALTLVARHLPDLARGRVDEEAAEEMSFAALLGGVNVATVSTCLPHRLQQAMGAVPGLSLSHGAGLALLYPAWLRHAEPARPELFAQVAQVLGGSDIHTVTGVLIEAAGLSARLSDRGVGRDDIDLCVRQVTGNLDNDPITEVAEVTEDLLRAVYEESL